MTELFSTRIRLDPEAPYVDQACRNADDMHRLVMRMYPETGRRNESRKIFNVIYSVKNNAKIQQVHLMIRSTIQPDTSRLGEMCLETNTKVLDISKYRNGENLRLRAPVCVVRRHHGISRKSIVNPAERTEKFRRMLESNGCRVEDAVLNRTRLRKVNKRRGSQCFQHMFLLSDFSAEITVMDQEAFRNMLICGLGPEKSYGAGMVCVEDWTWE